MAYLEKRTLVSGKTAYRVRIRLRGLPYISGTFPTRREATGHPKWRQRYGWADILEELWLSNALPVLVIHTFVAFEVALPSAIWTCTGSSGSFSFDQKYTQYDPILKT